MTREERDAAIRQILSDPEGGWRTLAIGHVCDEYAASQARAAPTAVIGPDGPRPVTRPQEGTP